MNKDKNVLSSRKLADMVVHGMQEKKAKDIVLLDLREVNGAVSDYFVIGHADSSIQVNAIAKSVEEEVYKSFFQDPWHKEGLNNGEWVLLDFSDVVVHVFKTSARERYGIEELWGDAIVQEYQSA